MRRPRTHACVILSISPCQGKRATTKESQGTPSEDSSLGAPWCRTKYLVKTAQASVDSSRRPQILGMQ